jgi:predicted dehydrogenase/threonine dehydrogenase-like Zn-dependent dehydrogenase
MKQIAQNYKSGELVLTDTPEPQCAPGGVLVRTEYSLISSGTELMKLGEAKLSLLGKARARPDQVKKVLETVAQQGPQAAFTKVMNRLDSYTPLGYSLSGRVVEVGAGVSGFVVGQRVACAGNKYALHAEVNWVPVSLCVPVPEHVDPRHAAFTTVGAIAMQGVRQAGVTLGETVVVIGLGLVGQLAALLARAAGARVIGVDPVAARCHLAEQVGAVCADSGDGAGLERVMRTLTTLTAGAGADAVLLAASGPTSEPVELAAKLARDRATIVNVGKTKLELPYDPYFEKELDLRFSRSYGPGRYDPTYEVEGVDYPIGYVRWTERRNLAAFVDLLADGKIELEALVSKVVPFEDAVSTYEALRSGGLAGIGFVFEYAPAPPSPRATRTTRTATGPSEPRRRTHHVTVGFIGCGNYASTMLLPRLTSRSDVRLEHVCTSTSLSAVSAQRKFAFEQAGTDVTAVLDDDAVDAVFIVTPHASHASLTIEALRRGKAVFVEKPLAITAAELDDIEAAIVDSGNDRLHVGFNRRFSPLLTDLHTKFGPKRGPMSLRYLVNAGAGDPRGWGANAALHGGRFLGEAGHFIDTMAWWTGADPIAVVSTWPQGQPDDITATIEFADGSVGTLVYSTGGPPRFPKESFDVLGAGRAARLDNFRTATSWTGNRRRRRWATAVDKGQAPQLDAFIRSVRTGSAMPIPLRSLVAVTATTLMAADAAARLTRVSVESWRSRHRVGDGLT